MQVPARNTKDEQLSAFWVKLTLSPHETRNVT